MHQIFDISGCCSSREHQLGKECYHHCKLCRYDVEVGEYGPGKRNDKGEKLVEFCRRLKLVATNTWFRQHKRRRYTWTRPDGDWYQLDYILVRLRYRNSVKNSHSYPGADINSDHKLVAMRACVRLKKV